MMSSSHSRVQCPTCLQEFPSSLGVCPIHGLALVSRTSVRPTASSQRTVIVGRYTIKSLIGEGGMARVYAADDGQSGARVAVKVLSRLYAGDPRERERFVREAKTIARIAHPSVVKLLDSGAQEDGRPYLVMELLEGESLAERLKRDGRVDVELALSIGADVARGLHAAHMAGVVHRDVKPGNVFLTRGGGAKLLDFGLAKTYAATALTEADVSVGTASYMAPEQLLADGVDDRTDGFALGVTLYRAITGAMPYDARGKTELLFRQIVDLAPLASTRRPDVGPAVDAILAVALRKNPASRFAHLEAFAHALDAARERRDVAPPLPPEVPPVHYVPRSDMAVRVARSLWGMKGLEAPF